MRRTLAIMAALAVATPAATRAPQVGDLAPDVKLKLMDGRTVQLSELRGQVVVLNFWATWCVPCRHELPLLDSYYKMQKPYGLAVFAVATEDSLQPFQMKPLFAKMSVTPTRRIGAPYETLGGVPTNYVIDRSGHVRWAKAAAFDLDDLNTILVPLLKEPAPAS